MIPLLYLFSIAAYDEMNEWQTYRLTLPTTRKDIMIGRYASLLFVALISALAGIIVSYITGFIIELISPQSAADFRIIVELHQPQRRIPFNAFPFR